MSTIGRLVPAVLVLFVALVSSFDTQAQTCEFAFGAKRFEIQSRGDLKVEDVSTLNKQMTNRLLEESRGLELYYRTNPEKAQVDTVVVGDGVHGSIFSSAAAEKAARPSLLVIEAGDVVSRVFGKMRGTFDLNSRELPDRSTNRYPASPVAMKDLTPAEFVSSLSMAAMATSAQYSSAVPVLFNNKVVDVVDSWSLGDSREKPRYLVRTSAGLAIRANKVVYATGLGDPVVPLKDPASKAFLTEEMQKTDTRSAELNDVMNVDDFHAVVSRAKELGLDLGPKIKGKTHLVLGQGDGGKITIEEILKLDPEAKIIWVGQKAKTPDEYKASTWERYFRIASKIGTQIQTVGDYASTVERRVDGRFVVTCEKIQAIVEGDMIYLATGYAKSYPQTLNNLKGPRSLESSQWATQKILSPLENGQERTAIGVRLMTNPTDRQDLFVVGPGAGQLATSKELEASVTENPVSIEVLGPRTAAMARRLVAQGADAVTTLYSSRYRVTEGRLNFGSSNDASKLSLAATELMFKVEFTRLLRRFDVEGRELDMRFRASNDGATAVASVGGLKPESAQVLLRVIEADPEMRALLPVLLAQGELYVKLPLREGRALAEWSLVRLSKSSQ